MLRYDFSGTMGDMTFSIVTLSITTFIIMTFSIKGLHVALSINDTEHN
jgi:hypothetical protein